MARPHPHVAPEKVRRVQEQFEGWRARKRGRERIPPRLWRAAAKLCQTHTVHQVSRWLRLNPGALRDWIRRSRSPDSRRSPAFVEWRPPALPLAAASSAEYLLEIERSGEPTLRVRVRGATVAEVAALGRALQREEPEG